MLDEGDVVRPGLVERPGGVEAEAGVPVDLSVDQRRQLPDGDAHAIPLSSLKGSPGRKVGWEVALSGRW